MEESTPVKKPGKKFRIKKKNLGLIIYILIVLLLIGIVYLYPKITGAMSGTMTIEYGDLKQSQKLTCYVVKDETVYYSDSTGSVGYLYSNGDMVRKGAQIVNITDCDGASESDYKDFNERVNSVSSRNPFLADSANGAEDLLSKVELQISKANGNDTRMLEYYSSQLQNVSGSASGFSLSDNDSAPDGTAGVTGTYSALSSGIVSYQFDGFEAQLNPATMTLLDRNALASIPDGSYNFATGKAAEGEPLFKIVDNRNWYIVAWIDENDLGSLHTDQKISVELPDNTVTGKVSQVIDQGGQIMVIMSFSTYYDELSSLRKVTASVVTSDASGLMIKNEFLTSKDGQVGVYVVDVDGGNSIFTPVKVIDTDGKYSLVESGTYYETDSEGATSQVKTVQVYDEVTMPPSGSDSGQSS